MATSTPVLDGIYELDGTHSTVQFSVRHIVSSFRASFGELEARLVIEDGVAEIGRASCRERV